MTLYILRHSRRILRGAAIIFRSSALHAASSACAELAWRATGSQVAGYTSDPHPRPFVFRAHQYRTHADVARRAA